MASFEITITGTIQAANEADAKKKKAALQALLGMSSVKQMVAAHSQGLFLFEALHHLLEACKVLAQRRWDEAMGPSAQATPVSPPAVGLPAAALVAALPRTSGTGSTRSSTGDGAPPSSLSGKLKRVFSLGRRPSSSGSSNSSSSPGSPDMITAAETFAMQNQSTLKKASSNA